MNLSKIAADDSGVSVVFIPADSYLTSRAKYIAQELRDAGIRTIGANHKLLSEGMLLGCVADYYSLGQQAAEIVDRHQNGSNLAEIPVERPRPKLVINRTTMKTLQLDLRSRSLATTYLP